MKTPAFWQKKSLLSSALLPLAGLYSLGALAHRKWSSPAKLSIPVICIGNLTAGGAGKTPVALSIGARLNKKNAGAFFLSRGYGANAKVPTLVNPDNHSARDVGDEPLLLARVLPTIIAKDRLAGARKAISLGAKLIVMDDGFQNYAFQKNFSLIVIDGVQGFGNGRLIPAGPLRERPASALKHANAIAVINPTSAHALPHNEPILYAKTNAKLSTPLAGKRCIAFCGLAYPEKFWRTLESTGADILERIAFPDHHFYSATDLENLAAHADNQQALLVTTEKDAVKLPSEFRARVKVIGLEITWDSPELLDKLLEYVIGSS